ncbi:hypothetical protein [Streptomyces mirabilis]|uniref:hypothetical protein n=1 Tax=Streptomyces mirabilis TaxID=68239 RepID=UPI0036C80314
MDEYAWPTGPKVPAADAVLRSWAATVAAPPVGARVAGKVIGRQRFGVFIHLDGVPNPVALAEVIAMPHGIELPALGARVEGEVLWHAEHNHQVKVRLDEWTTSAERSALGRPCAVRGRSAVTGGDNQ